VCILLLRALALFGCFSLLTGCGASNGDTNTAPSLSVVSTIAVAGGAEVTLRSSASDVDGSIEGYLWEQVSGEVVEVEGAATDTLTFEAPVGLDGYELVFRITATDNQGGSSSAKVTVIVAAGIAAPTSFKVRSPVNASGVVLDWDAISLPDSADGEITYSVYYARQTFNAISSLIYYESLDGAGVESGITTTSYQMNFTNGQKYFFLLVATYTSDTLVAESQPTAEVARVIGKAFTYTSPLNDTTVSQCVDLDGNWADCPVTGLIGQDAESGRTAAAAAGSLNKTGVGLGGFDWTLLDADGTVLSPGSEQADCIRDNVSGLVVELKNSATSLRNPVHQFSWYLADETTNGGYSGLEAGPECVAGVCNTAAYAMALNRRTLCGESSWRLPVVSELRSISDIAGACLLDGGGCKFALDYYYWTSATRADAPDQAWMVNLYGKTDTSYDKQATARVIMVSDGDSDE
tara:strand:- start:74 stop:1465 length:1392 start_codon:yes stop_codon:yes gene_type:complete